MEDTDVIHKKLSQLVKNPVMRKFIEDIIDIELYYDTAKVKNDKYDELLDRGQNHDK